MTSSRLRSAVFAALATALVSASLVAAPVGASTEPADETPSVSQPLDNDPTDAGDDPEPSPSPTETSDHDTSGDSQTEPEETDEPSPSPSPSPSPELSDGVETADHSPRIVVVTDRSDISTVRAFARDIGGDVEKTLAGAVNGFVANLTDAQVEFLQVRSDVEYIEDDLLMRIATSNFRNVTKTDTVDMGDIDDGSSEPYNLGFAINWFGIEYNQIIMNNNGGAVLNDGLGPFNAYGGIDLRKTTRPLILPLFTDLDSTGDGTGSLKFGRGSFGGKKVFWAEWTNVGEYPSSPPKYTFQMLLIEEADKAVTVEFNYDVVGVANSTFNKTFEVGFANPSGPDGDVVIGSSSEDPAVVSARLTGSKNTDSDRNGRWRYLVSSGGTPEPAPVPDPTDGIQTGAPWGLDRIDQRALPLNGTFSAPGNGSGVRAYIVDTGVRSTHVEFTGRIASGYTAISDINGTNDCHGHGTHVASSVAGTTYGVAKQATVVPVRVLNCSGSGTTSGVIAGLNWIRNNHNMSTPAVVNMSLGGRPSQALDDAVVALHDAGIPVVVAAGNDNTNASGFSPAREPKAITVGATTATDARASFSNFGPVLDIFAPGVSIIGAWRTSDTATVSISGTSMAAPHVAGAAAIYLGLNTSATPTQVANAITSTATTNIVTNAGTGSPNRLLYVRDLTSAGVGSPPPLVGSSGGGSGGGGSPGGGGSGGGGSSSGGGSSAGGGGGGGLNAITRINPGASGAPGTVIALAGWGLETTRAVNFNDFPASFSVVNGGHVEVTVPDIPAGVYVVHAVLAPEVGRASFWDGFAVTPRSASAPAGSPASSPAQPGKPATGEQVGESGEVADYLTFRGTSTALTPAMRTKLNRLARGLGDQPVQGTIVAFTNARGTAVSTRRATTRASAIRAYLQRAGVNGTLNVTTQPGSTAVQARSTLLYVTPAGTTANTSSTSDEVSSLIVRLRPGRTIEVNGAVRGANRVTGPIRNSLSVGPYLGLRMYRIDFAQPVSERVAKRVATQLARDPGIEFAEPDSIVTTQVSITSN